MNKLNIGSDYIFLQDNDPRHKSKIATKFFNLNKIKLLEWLVQYPDLNTIKNLWTAYKYYFYKLLCNSILETFIKINEL